MNKTKENIKISKKSLKPRVSLSHGDNAEVVGKRAVLPQHVFLYLHPKCITYSLEDIAKNRSEIELEHQYSTITTLTDHFTSRNVIQIDEFNVNKPTFSITITQDSLADITMLSDSPILLTLYVYKSRKSAENTDEGILEDMRIPVAQGHIDVIQYFNNKRLHYTDTIFLYPFTNYGQNFSCKIVWDIYTLHPLLKAVQISNFIFITFGALYNMNENDLMLTNDAQNLVASLSFITKTTKENNKYDKIFICNFKTFTKTIISQQNLCVSWESLKSKDKESGNINSMGIGADTKMHLNQLFSNLLSTNNVDLNFSGININEDFALICNSIHRYVLDDGMEKILENVLALNLYQIILEIYSERDESKILLQGYLDLSIFMYPNVNHCSFGIELKPPSAYKSNYQATANTENLKKKRKSKTLHNHSQERPTNEEKKPFAIIKIGLYTPITNPCEDIAGEISKQPHNFTKNVVTIRSNIDQNYRAFDDLIREILDYININNIKTLDDDKEFFCYELSNINNKIMKLMACDFNIRTPTKTSVEFMNLTTNVYRELTSRIYDYINKCSVVKDLEDCVFTMPDIQNFLVENMSIAKYLYEIGDLEMANIFMNKLRTGYPNNSMLKFYILLYDIERQNFELALEYLNLSLADKDIEGELFAKLIRIYVNYKLQLQDSGKNETADEDLIKALSDYCTSHDPKNLTAFILFYCVYKRHNYQTGMEYCRWNYENLYDIMFVELKFIPKSRWEIHMPHKIYLKTLKGQNFFKVCYKLLRLGLYNFAQWVFDEIENECTEIEKYFFSSTFMIMENRVTDNLPTIKNFDVGNYANPIQLRATLSLVNGNLEHFRVAHGPLSLTHYQNIAELKHLNDYEPYQVGLLRYAYKLLKDQHYEKSARVFLSLCNDKVNCIVAAVGRGKSCYYLEQLDEAEKYFSLSTEIGIYMPKTWAYLAIINLKKGNNYNALECWKYSRLNENEEISEEITNELNKINYNDVFLYVDLPNKT